MTPTKSTAAKAEPAAAPKDPQGPPAEQAPKEKPAEYLQPGEEGWEPQKLSTKAPEVGGHLLYRGDSGPVFALVTAGGEGEAEVLLLRPDEVVRGRTVAVYDSAEDAERGYGEGRPHVAWHL